MYLKSCILITFCLTVPLVHCLENFNNMESSVIINAGRKQYELLINRIEMPQFGACWKNAVQVLHNSCSKLSEQSQSLLALSFTDCFLKMSGEKFYSCHLYSEIPERKACMKSMPDRAFSAYLEFYTHTQSICFFLKSSVWQEGAEDTIARLTDTSKDISNQLIEVRGSNEALMKTQLESLNIQQDLVQNGLTLGQILQESRMSVAALMTELRESTAKQAGALGDLSQRLSELQAWAIGEVSWIESLIYYVISVGIAYMLTCFPRSQDARFWLLLILTSSLGLEQMLHYLIIKEKMKDTFVLHYLQDNLYYWIWHLRTGIVIICGLVYVYCIYIYTDYTHVNHVLLKRIHDQLNVLSEQMRQEQASDLALQECSSLTPVNGHNTLNNVVQVSLLSKQVQSLSENGYASSPRIVEVDGGMEPAPASLGVARSPPVTPSVHTPHTSSHSQEKRVQSARKRHTPAIFTIETDGIKLSSPGYNLRNRSSTPRPRR